MKRLFGSDVSLFLADILIFCLCCGGLYLIILKADLPFKTTSIDSKLLVHVIIENTQNIRPGDEILSVDNLSLTRWEEVELHLDSKKVGDKVTLEINRNGQKLFAEITLTNYYTLLELLIIGFVGLVFLVMGVFVRIKASDNISAQLFHWASVGLGMVIVMTAGHYNNQHFSYGHINRIVWLLVYSFTPVLFIHFTSSFVRTNIQIKRYILSFFYLLALINTIILAYLFLNGTIENSLISLKNYVTFFDLFFRIFLITCIVIAISLCIYEYAKATDREERKRYQWLLLGFFIGPFSFVIFWVIPIYLTGYSLIPESLVLIFLTAIPITFSIAIVKYRLMDINLIIRRSVLYTIILATIILTYAGVSSFITLFVRNYNPAIPSVLTALAVVFLLQPVKILVQKFVDRKFFRLEYDFREEQNGFLDAIKNVYNIQTLAALIIERVDKLLPVEKLGYFELNNDDGRIRIIASKGFELLHGRSIRFEFENLKTDLSLPIVVDDKVEAGLKVESADIKVFRRWGMVLVFPVKSPTGVIHAFLVLGAKKSGIRFLKDDVELLNSLVFAVALATDRIKLQEELIREHLESERLEELNRLKSFFMQTITHDLKTPLTSIKLFVEKLQDMKQPDKEKSDLCLEIIDGESNKLRRLIDNILDYARIEEGMKSYNLKCNDLVKISERAINTIKYQFMINNQILEHRLPAESIIIEADEEAIERAITNLLTNAIKYSSTGCKTKINLSKQNGYACFEVVDEGRGISSQDLDHIFEPFRRVKITDDQKIEGTGLGLAIVKHIVDAHNGKVQVKSEPGKGSTFTLYFPIKNE